MIIDHGKATTFIDVMTLFQRHERALGRWTMTMMMAFKGYELKKPFS